jgi:ankyrin repeat protein
MNGCNGKIAILGAIAYMFSWLLTGCATTQEKLSQAIQQGNIEQVKQSLNSGANPNEGLKIALQNKQADIVRLLVDRGADPNHCGWVYGKTVRQYKCLLHRVVENNQTDAARLLLSHGADPNIRENYLIDDIKVVDSISKDEYAARYPIREKLGSGIPVGRVQIVSDNPDVKGRGETILASGNCYYRYKIKRIGGVTPIYKAIDNRNIEIIHALVESGAVVTEPCVDGYTLFCFNMYDDTYDNYNEEISYHVIQGNSFTRPTRIVAVPPGKQIRVSCNIVKMGDGFTAYQEPMGGAVKVDSALDYARSKGNTEIIQILESAAKTQNKRQ